MTLLDEVLETVSRLDIRYINILFTNLIGKLHLVSIPASELEDAVKHGVGFDGSSAGFVGVEVSDLLLKPDPSTFVVLPWEKEPRVGAMIGELYREGRPFELDPRGILRRALKRLREVLGDDVEYMASPEVEFWLFVKGDGGEVSFHDDAGYFSAPPKDRGYNIRLEIAEVLNSMGIHPVKIHHEVPPGKHEIDFRFGPALKIADATVMYKFAVRSIAARHGLIASFMPKPFYGQYGAGMHTHQSLMNLKSRSNLFYGPNYQNLSKLALNYIGGLIRHAREIAVLTNPTVNSYKRLVPGWEAPVYVTWARYNRSALIRVPMTTDPRKVRIEYRATDGSCNPYLAFAAMLTAGIVGIKESIEPPPPVEENIYKMTPEERRRRGIDTLPGSLGEAITEAEKSIIVKEVLGEEAFNKYMEEKRKEWFEYNVMVHEWERKRYLDL